MKRCLFGLCILLFSLISDAQSKSKKKDIKGIRIVNHIPGLKISQGNQMVEQDMTYNVFYSGNIVLYQFFYSYGKGAIDSKDATHETRHSFFVFHKDSLYGYNYSPFLEEKERREGRKQVGETLTFNTVNTGNMDTLAILKADSTTTDKKGNLTKWYTFHVPDQGQMIVTLHYINNLNWVNETFSSRLDNVPGQKLTRVAMYMDEPCKLPCHMITRQDPAYLELKEIRDFNREEIAGYFERYKKESK